MSLPLNQVGKEGVNFTSKRNNWKEGERCGDLLEEELLRHSKAAEQVLITLSLLIDSLFGEEDWDEVYSWFQSQLKGTDESLANRIEI